MQPVVKFKIHKRCFIEFVSNPYFTFSSCNVFIYWLVCPWFKSALSSLAWDSWDCCSVCNIGPGGGGWVLTSINHIGTNITTISLLDQESFEIQSQKQS